MTVGANLMPRKAAIADRMRPVAAQASKPIAGMCCRREEDLPGEHSMRVDRVRVGFYAHAGKSSRGGDSHPSALTEPDVRLSPHPALTIERTGARHFATAQAPCDPAERRDRATHELPCGSGAEALCISDAPTE